MEKYVAALHVYVDIAGQNNTSYASALANIGECSLDIDTFATSWVETVLYAVYHQ